MSTPLGYNPAKLASEVYHQSVVSRMSRLGFDLIANTVIDSNDAPYRWDHIVYARYTNLVFKHRELAFVVCASHRETAGTNEKNASADGLNDGIDPNHYRSYWHLDVIARWADDTQDPVWDTRDNAFGDFTTHHNCGGSYSNQQADVDIEAFAKTKDGDFLWNQRISAHDLCQPLLQYLANMRGKMARGKIAMLWTSNLVSSEFSEAIFTAKLRSSGAIVRIAALTDRLPSLEKVA